MRTLTGEGGHLRRDATLAQHRDFELLPDALWRALALWYGAPAPLPRQVRAPLTSLTLLRPLELLPDALWRALALWSGLWSVRHSKVEYSPPRVVDGA